MKYLYVLKDPVNKKVRYIGASKNPKSRYAQHLRDSRKTKKTAKTQKQIWIAELLNKGLQPVIEIIEKIEDNSKARIQEEKLLIKYINTAFNLHMPGKGSRGVKHFKKQKAKKC